MISDRFDVCWSGATWRTYPQPTVPPPPVKPETPDAVARVAAVLTRDWLSRSALREYAAIDMRLMKVALDTLIAQGRAERRVEGGTGSGRRGRVRTHYRRPA